MTNGVTKHHVPAEELMKTIKEFFVNMFQIASLTFRILISMKEVSSDFFTAVAAYQLAIDQF